MTMFKQRGNLTECVQWTGFNLDEVKEFCEARYNEDMKGRHVEYIETLLRHFIIVVNFTLDEVVVFGGKPIKRGTWLVDQGPESESPLGVVFCEPERFKTLYEAVDEDA